MNYKATPVYVVMRHDKVTDDKTPVAVFKDLATATGNADGYNLDMTERNIDGIHFYIAVTMLYE